MSTRSQISVRIVAPAFAAGLAAATFAAGDARAFPDEPVSYVVPFERGDDSDIAARFQEPYFAEITGQELIVQNMPGQGGAEAWSALNDHEGDGQTIMAVSLPHIVLQPMIEEPGYETGEIVAVYMSNFTPTALFAAADSPYQTLEQVIDAARRGPGALTVSGTGTASAHHVMNQRMLEMAEVDMTYIPHTGTAAASTAMVDGETDFQWGYPTVAIEQGDRVRMLAVALEERHPLFPEVPTFRELGIDIVGGAYRGVAVPDDTPWEIRRQLSDIFAEINANEEFVAQMEGAGFTLIDVPYEQMDDWMAERRDTYAEIAEQLFERTQGDPQQQ